MFFNLNGIKLKGAHLLCNLGEPQREGKSTDDSKQTILKYFTAFTTINFYLHPSLTLPLKPVSIQAGILSRVYLNYCF